MQIEDTKAIHARILEGIPILEEEKWETKDKLEELAGKPEKLRKQVQDQILSFTFPAIIIIMSRTYV